MPENDNDRYVSPSDVDAFMKRLTVILILAGAVVLVPLVFYARHLEQRFGDFEASLQYRAPVPEDEPATGRPRNYVALNAAEGQTVYVPAYSHVYHRDGRPHLLTVTLSVRNTSRDKDIRVESVEYYDTKGGLVKSYLEKPLRLKPLATAEFLVERDDTSGGSGANFLVEWSADEPVSHALIEAIMIDTSGNQGISFARKGEVISEIRPSSAGPMQPSEPVAPMP